MRNRVKRLTESVRAAEQPVRWRYVRKISASELSAKKSPWKVSKAELERAVAEFERNRKRRENQ